jgi:2-succinyl-5-enolpyruvyl-6-hydroxy-3-cyclohexene-1-carboxylate synthase
MLQNRNSLKILSSLMARRGITQVVISPGSRNAPIINLFGNDKRFTCYTVVDERSAGFFALGIAQQTGKTVAITCTSGSAALNLAPAIAEAYYQRIPLLVLTADRPPEMIDKGFGQTIRQVGIFSNFIRKTLILPEISATQNQINEASRLCSEALDCCANPVNGPVHLNIPLSEPLYGPTEPLDNEPTYFQAEAVNSAPDQGQWQQMAEKFNQSAKVMILVGQSNPNKKLENILKQFVNEKGVVVLSETTSNLHGNQFITWIDRCLEDINPTDSAFVPDLLITCGTSVLSKKIKVWLKNAKPKSHWHVDIDHIQMDTYGRLEMTIPLFAVDFFSRFLPLVSSPGKLFQDSWFTLSGKVKTRHSNFMEYCLYSDLKVFAEVIESIPTVYDLQLANSTVVRYAQLFDYDKQFDVYCNRGVSGIDGSFSTSVGSALASGNPTLHITGDLAFLYDSNALWNKHYPNNLKVIVLNNGGGGIFRILDGPESTGLLQEHFEASHSISVKGIVETFGIKYLQANDVDSLQKSLHSLFLNPNEPIVLEVFTPAEANAKVLKEYFASLKMINENHK